MAEEGKYEVIHSHVYDPKHSLFKSSPNEHAKCFTVSCKGRDRCGLHAKGQCSEVNFLGGSCPYGKSFREQGPTKRSHGMGKWVKEKEESFKAVLDKMSATSDVLAIVGDYVFLPYSHMSMNKDAPFLSHSHLFSNGIAFMPLEKLTEDVILSILDFRPMALIGGEIKSYQKEVVPLFIAHLRERMPELFTRVAIKRPGLAYQAEAFSPVGRKALLRTMAKGSVFHKSNESWTWDGEYLVSTDLRILFCIVPYNEVSAKIKPARDAVVAVEDPGQVTPETVFVT